MVAPVSRAAADVPCTVVCRPPDVDLIREEIWSAERVALDTEVPIEGPSAGELRVLSIAVRSPSGERVFVVDVRDLDPTLLAPVLSGVTADAWNAGFDARVLDAAIWNTSDTTAEITWWDAQLADALLHQGRSGFTWYHGLAWATAHYVGIHAAGKGTVQRSFTASDDLTETQIAYAAADAVHTLWVADAIRSELHRAGLDEICAIEQGARPFLDQMERTGIWFDWEGWEAELVRIEAQRRTVLGRLASMTGGGQGSLFDDVTEPTWNPASDSQTRAALNQWAEPEVRTWTAQRHGEPRLLNETDSMRAAVLKEIGGPLCEALLEVRNHAKIITTYGESIAEHLGADGRLRPQYLQVVGTNTGRLASRNPNAQNLAPQMKPFLRPQSDQRVFVYADLSQAELRYLAQVAEDEPLRRAFARDDDVHVRTAATMFGFDPAALATSDPARLQHLRQIAKALNFGIVYGSGAAALARALSAEGNPTTTDEAADLLARYRTTYPGTTAWAAARVAEIKRFADETAAIDWASSLRLARGFRDVSGIRREFRAVHGRWPSADEIAERHPDRMERPDIVAQVRWILEYPAPVALLSDGRPFRFAGRTLAGRRQTFELHLDRVMLSAAMSAIRSVEPGWAGVRRRFQHDHAVDLGDRSDTELERTFESRRLRRLYVEAIVSELGWPAAEMSLRRAARERVSAMVNAWRNAPIQGGVADVMLTAYGDLHRRLRRFTDAFPVQTVHDSVVVECNRAEASVVAAEVQAALESASRRFCPDVVPRADVDIRRSLAESDTLEGAADPTSTGRAIGVLEGGERPIALQPPSHRPPHDGIEMGTVGSDP